MSVNIVTGATRGIGFEAAKYLRGLGNEVVNIDIDRGDVTADLATPEGREKAIAAVYERYGEDGVDGLILNAGVAYDDPPSRIPSLNYFGVVVLAERLYPLLRKKGGRCAVTVSGGVSYLGYKRKKYFIDSLLVNCGDEERIGELVNSFPREVIEHSIYLSTKIALIWYIRRVAPAWAVAGVSLNGLAPGSVDTAIMDNVPGHAEQVKAGRFPHQTIQTPTIFGIRNKMDPADVGQALGTLVLPEAKGMCGSIVYCDGGAASVLHPEKWY